MGFDQKGAPVLRVTPSGGKGWEVWEEGFEKPLALFDNKNDACEYANDLAKTKATATVIIDEGNGAPSGSGH